MIFHPDNLPRATKWREGKTWSRAEVKFDGYRVALVREVGTHHAYFRGLADRLRELPAHIVDQVHCLPRNTLVDGELYVPGQPASEVPRAIKEKSLELTYQPFAVPMYKGSHVDSASFTERDSLIMSICGRWEPPASVPSVEGSYVDIAKIAADMQAEGIMLKEGHLFNWYKVKPVWTVDAVVMATKPGKGKHAGRLGALVCGVWQGESLVEIASVGKGNDEKWRDLTDLDVVGNVVEIAHEGVGAGNKLKFSSFVRWREDKHREECLWDQLS